MQVLKFGGSSVASASAISRVTGIVSKALEQDRTIVVCSAISRCTDTLIEIGRRAAGRDESCLTLLQELQDRHHTIIRELLPAVFQEKVTAVVDGLFGELRDTVRGVFLLGELSPTSLDAIESYGELFSTKIIFAKFSSLGISCKWLDAREIIRVADGHVDQDATYRNVREAVDGHTSLFIVPGFIASDAQGRVRTLGRGGSDYTASLLAVGIRARLVEIWTDVPGIMTANPKVVPTARTIRNISYRSAQELSHFGAKVIYPPTIQPVVEEGIPIYVRDTFDPEGGSTLVEKYPPQGTEDVLGISNSDNIALISLEGSGMVGIPGFSSRLFDALSRAGINIILITQASSVHTMCIAISAADAPRAKQAADECFAWEISQGRLRPLKVETGFSIICLIGNDVLGHSGATGRMLAALGRRSIPVRATAQGSSERNISVIVPSDRVEEARIENAQKELQVIDDMPSDILQKLAYGPEGAVDWEDLFRTEPAPNQLYKFTWSGETICARYDAQRGRVTAVRKKEAYGIRPRNDEQRFALDACLNPEIQLVSLTGGAGTGKTLIALAAALEQARDYDQIILSRPTVILGNQEIGFLPGDEKTKMSPFLQPLMDNLGVIKSQFRPSSKEALKLDGFLKDEKLLITPLAYIRGRSLGKAFFIIDEAQNLTPHEVKTIITRAGEGTKMVFTGDIFQIDQPYLDQWSNGLTHLGEKMAGQRLFQHVFLRKGERSELSEIAAKLL